MARTNVEVLFYSGYKGEESPRALILDGREYAIEEILKRERVLSPETGETREVFVCRVAAGRVRLAKAGRGSWTAQFVEA